MHAPAVLVKCLSITVTMKSHVDIASNMKETAIIFYVCILAFFSIILTILPRLTIHNKRIDSLVFISLVNKYGARKKIQIGQEPLN